LSAAQRRQVIAGECKQLKRDEDHHNEISEREVPSQIDFNFTRDAQEMTLPTEYPEAPPEDEESES